MEQREGLAVGTGDAELPLRLKPECGKAQEHHSETIIKPFSSSGGGRFKITTMEQCNKTQTETKRPAENISIFSKHPHPREPQAAVIPLIFSFNS